MNTEDVAAIERLITRLLLRYAHAVDRRDYEAVARCYWDDAHDEHGSFDGDALAYVAWLRVVLPKVSVSSHQFTNILVDVSACDAATSETYCLNVSVFANRGGEASEGESQRQTTALLRYLDRFQCRDGEWRIADRRVVTDWSRVEMTTPMVR